MEKIKHSRSQLVLGVCCVLALLSIIVVTYYYTWHMPKAADQTDGRIFAVAVNYGRVVFVTSYERALLWGTQAAFFLSGVLAILSVYFANKKPRKPRSE